MSVDQKLLYRSCRAIIDGVCPPDLAKRTLGPLFHVRWITLALRINFLYMSIASPSEEQQLEHARRFQGRPPRRAHVHRLLERGRRQVTQLRSTDRSMAECSITPLTGVEITLDLNLQHQPSTFTLNPHLEPSH